MAEMDKVAPVEVTTEAAPVVAASPAVEAAPAKTAVKKRAPRKSQAARGPQAKVIGKTDQYLHGDLECFRVRFDDRTCEDIPRDLTRLTAKELRVYAKLLRLRNFSKMRKQELLTAIAPLFQFA